MRWPPLHRIFFGAAALLLAHNGASAAPRAGNEPNEPEEDRAGEGDTSDSDPDEESGGVVDRVTIVGRSEREFGLRDLVGDDSLAVGAATALEEAEFSTLLRVADFEGETRTLADVLASSVGANVRSLGGLGAFSSLSVRGGASGHTTVFVDGVPQPQLGSATIDLAQLELESFSDVELYRGNPPTHLGGGALGGALHLTTAVGAPPSGDRLTLAAGAGSFGARHLRARYLGGQEDGLAYHLSAGYAGATGDFPFFNDRGTNLSPDDSEVVPRQNNGYDRGDAVARARLRRGTRIYEGGGRLSYKSQGIPGPGHRQSEHTSLATLANQIDGRLTAQSPWGLAGALGHAASYARVEHQRYRDLDGEIGLGAQNLRYLTASGGGRAGLDLPIGARQVLLTGLSARAEAFDERHQQTGRQGARGVRLELGLDVADEVHIAADRFILRPALRLDLHHTAPLLDDEEASTVTEGELSRRTDVHPSPRLAARLRVLEPLALKASAGWYFRAPTVYELFGDRGAIVGNPELRPETGPSADAGFVLAPSGRYGGVFDRLFAEAVGFAKRPRDAIVFASRSALVAKATNLDSALIVGTELRASARLLRAITIAGNYTFVETRQRSVQASFDGKRLPHRPAHEAYARIDAAHKIAGRLASVWADGTYVAGNYLDRANFREVPPRALFGAGAKLEPISGLIVGLEVKNLANRRIEQIELSPPPSPDLTEIPAAVTDVFGHPLPGRAAYATLEWRR